MTEQQAKAVEVHEKPALASKKFKAFLLVEIGFFTLMGMMIWMQEIDTLAENTSFLVLAVTAGFMGVGFCLGQSYVDKYVRVAAITMGKKSGDTSE